MNKSRILQQRARSLRHKQTGAEQTLWRYLRNRQLGGYKFRRQVVIENYIADFLCAEKKLIIEADGGQHIEQKHYDQARTIRFKDLGYCVLRFWNHEILNQTDEVLMVIFETLEE